MQYRLKIVFVDSQELILETTEKHGFSDDLELFEVTTADEIFVIPLKQIKYIACDSKIFKKWLVKAQIYFCYSRIRAFFFHVSSLNFPWQNFSKSTSFKVRGLPSIKFSLLPSEPTFLARSSLCLSVFDSAGSDL